MKKEETGDEFSKVDLDYLVQSSIDNAKNEDDVENEVKIFQNALEFSDTKVRDCMIPRTEIKAVEYDSSKEDLMQKFIESGNSKIIVYHDDIDHIDGYIHSSEMFRNTTGDWHTSICKMPFVPETMTARKLMKIFLHDKRSLGIVVDEFGGTSGIVTMEDILEEIVGEISDEYDDDEKQYSKLSDGSYIFEAKIQLSDFFRVVNVSENEFGNLTEEVETLAGLLLEIKGDLPERREIIDYKQYRFQILEADNRRILKVKYTELPM